MLCLIALITGCNSDTPQRKAEKLINRYLENNLKDTDSYECMDMGKIGIVTPMSTALVETVKSATDGEFPTDSINSKLEQIKAMFENKGINPYYTDVYKRQLHTFMNTTPFDTSVCIRNEEVSPVTPQHIDNAMAVSYTHLDVYKRQKVNQE